MRPRPYARVPVPHPLRTDRRVLLAHGQQAITARERRVADLFPASAQLLHRPLLGPDGLELHSHRPAEEGIRGVLLEPRVEVVAVPRSEQPPEPTVRLEQVHQVVVEVVDREIAHGPRMQGPHIDHVVAHEQIRPRAGVRGADPERRDGRTDHVRRPPHGEGRRGPGFGGTQAGKDRPDEVVAANRVAQEPAPLPRDLVGGADDLHSQGGVHARAPRGSGRTPACSCRDRAATPRAPAGARRETPAARDEHPPARCGNRPRRGGSSR